MARGEDSSAQQAGIKQEKIEHARHKAYLFAGAAGLAGLMFGLDTGVISGALKFIAQDLGADDRTQEWIVSSLMMGAAGGSLLAIPVARHSGRRGAMLYAGLLFLIGTALCSVAHSVGMMIAGRVILGVAVGFASFSAPLYIAEITEKRQRGKMISLYQLVITGGMLLAMFSDSLLAYGGHWRWMLGILAVPTLIFILATMNVPYSPRWLVSRGRRKEASHVLQLLRGSQAAAQEELARIEKNLQREDGNGFTLLKTSPGFRKTFLLGIGLQAFQQLAGINILLYYAPHVLEHLHFSSEAAVWCTTLLGFANMLATGVAILLIDRWGRRPLLLLSTSIATVSLCLFGLVLFLKIGGVAGSIATIALLVTFILGFAIGEGPVPWTMCTEIQPLKGRGLAIACSTFANWSTNWLISNIFLSLMAALGDYGIFWMLAVFNAIFFLIALFFVPETKGCSLEEIEERLNEGARLRDLGQPASGSSGRHLTQDAGGAGRA
ncbi:sugar porter family MFS transporter [Acetobacter oeni]|uniref:Galactose-proton symporter n=1 Tax=Acetobacter oeni TaxID=304077 RepID=A0A511XML9_9PROT|nr:sugar porter family MFS transporter [Acetobacter oeni]MBB3884158.1 SP family galactose:H+ symporter-like MFS transporter [Acetobacter oeni]NHO20160.1 sugar porter family MFS transporter [Acetobacter oeni]GBR04404.1 sugar-proton symporter [Acetobacter oeni LMG 21952]GEN64195.1 galactose-proton symporter [Acetobacter oeni]